MRGQTDVVVRAITKEQAFRVVTAITTETVATIVDKQRAKGITAELLGNLVTGTMMIRETMAPQLRVQGILRTANGRGSLVADSHPDGTNRGLVTLAPGEDRVTLGKGTLLQIMRTLPNGSIHQGIVELEAAHDLSDAFMIYMHESEQIKTNIAVGTVVLDSKVLVAGGYFVQLLPEISQETLSIMVDKLDHMPHIKQLLSSEDTTARSMLANLLRDIPYDITSESPISFGCNCSHERIVAGLATLNREELEQLIEEGEPLSITCDYCGKEYTVTVNELQGLLEKD